MKHYTSKEICEYLGIKYTSYLSTPSVLIQRAHSMQVEIEVLPEKENRGYAYQVINDERAQNEIWIDCYINNKWEVSNLGNIRKKNTKTLLKVSYNQNGYRIVDARRDRNKESAQGGIFVAHRLIYFSFHIDEIARADQLQIDHINGRRNDNRLENLRAVSNLQNQQFKEENRKDIKDIINQLINKYGYEETYEKIQSLL